MPSDEPAISVCNLSKSYRLFGHPGDRIKQFFSLGLKQYHREFTARENAYFQGALMGFTQEQMDKRFDEIAAFADIGEFIDQPVRTYSSGMFVRLAFATAIHVEPDILLVDEALAVGDARFQARCFGRLHAMRDEGATIMLVSHSTEQILRHCDRVGLLESGTLVAPLGIPRSMVNRYIAMHSAAPNTLSNSTMSNVSDIEPFQSRPGYNPSEARSGNGRARIYDFRLTMPDVPDGQLGLDLDIVFFSDVTTPLYGLFIRTAEGITLFATNSEDRDAQTIPALPQKSADRITVHFALYPNLCAGDYFFSIAVSDISHGDKEVLDRRHDAIHWAPHQPTSLGGMVSMRPAIHVTSAPGTNLS